MKKQASLLPEYYAFFDVDGTLLKLKSTHSFLKYFLQKRSAAGFFGLINYQFYVTKIKIFEKLNIKRERLNEMYYRNYRGIGKQYLNQLASEWFEGLLKSEDLFITSTLEMLKKHKKNGAKIILVSGSFHECLAPMAAYLEVDHVLATSLHEETGICSGKTEGRPMIGQGKANAIHRYLSENNYTDFGQCYAYGDHISDAPMLRLVGHAAVIEGDVELTNYAKSCQWQLLPNY